VPVYPPSRTSRKWRRFQRPVRGVGDGGLAELLMGYRRYA